MSVDVLIVVSTSDADHYLTPLLDALQRASSEVAVFLTNDGVQLAARGHLQKAFSTTRDAIVCADSWARFCPEQECPLTLGSQTDHSKLAGVASRIISL